MTLSQLTYVLAVYRLGNFGAAAKACHITQPTLSMQIKKLEEESGIVVFDRSRQPVVPTQAGYAFIKQAEQVVHEHEKLQAVVAQLKGSMAGELKIGVIPTLAPYFLPYAAGAFARKYREVHLRLVELTTDEIVAKLTTDQLDAGLLVTPLRHSGIVEEKLFYEEIFLYAHPNHQVSQLSEVTLADLAQPGMWLLASGHCFRHQVLNLCSFSKEHATDMPFAFEGGSLETLRRLVDSEGGFTLLPELTTQELNEDQLQNLKQFAAPCPLREVSLVHTTSQAKVSILNAFKEVVLQHLPARLLQGDRGVVVEWK